MRARELLQWWGVPGLSSQPPTWWFTSTCNSRSRELTALFWLHRYIYTHTYTHIEAFYFSLLKKWGIWPTVSFSMCSMPSWTLKKCELIWSSRQPSEVSASLTPFYRYRNRHLPKWCTWEQVVCPHVLALSVLCSGDRVSSSISAESAKKQVDRHQRWPVCKAGALFLVEHLRVWHLRVRPTDFSGEAQDGDLLSSLWVHESCWIKGI